jgi:hypothetical protein
VVKRRVSAEYFLGEKESCWLTALLAMGSVVALVLAVAMMSIGSGL